MNDRQLLELAAKAAGMEYPSGQTYCETLGVWGMLEKRPYHWWNPLADDGDALRLAVKLQLNIRHESWDVFVERVLRPEVSVGEGITMGYEREEATRRAIVRAAAEIGKEMA